VSGKNQYVKPNTSEAVPIIHHTIFCKNLSTLTAQTLQTCSDFRQLL